MSRFLMAAVLVLYGGFALAQRPGFLPIPPGQEIVLKAERADVPLGPIVVPFTKGWSFRLRGQLFIGVAPDGSRFEATYAYDPSAMRDTERQQAFAKDNRGRLPEFQTKWASDFGQIVKPCTEELQPLERFRFICSAERTSDGKREYLVAYAYVGRWALVFLNFYGQGEAAKGFEQAEAILSNARWDDEAAQQPVQR